MLSFCFAALILLTQLSPAFADSQSWGYQGQLGPAHWADLNPKFKLCKKGKRQSPISLKSKLKHSGVPIHFLYRASPLKILNNGHTIQVNPQKGSAIRLGNNKFELAQLHFHSPSEHLLQGKSYPLEMHLVHKNEVGNLAVVGVLFKEGSENRFLGDIWSHLPETQKVIRMVSSVLVNPMNLLPQEHQFFQYSGSLTTPPCTEDVEWNISQKILEASRDQILRFQSFYKMNARPVQPLNGRLIKRAGF